MSLITKPNYKKHVGTPNDSIYLKPIFFYCHLCKSNGRTKTRKNLWQLYCHFYNYHYDENKTEWQKLIDNLENLIKMGVIR